VGKGIERIESYFVPVETGAPTSPVAGVVLSGKDGYSAVSFFDIAQGSRA